MQSPTDPEDRTGTIGVEAFDATYGAGCQAADDSPHAVELVEDGGAFVTHRPANADRRRRVAFVDGTLRTEARLTRTGADGDVGMGLAGSWAAGAVLVDGDEPARFDQVTTGRTAIFTGGPPSTSPTTATAGAGSRTRWTEPTSKRPVSSFAETLSNEGWLTVLDGPLHGIRHRRGLAIIGYGEDASPPNARPRALGQGAGADGRGTVGPLRMEDAATRSQKKSLAAIALPSCRRTNACTTRRRAICGRPMRCLIRETGGRR